MVRKKYDTMNDVPIGTEMLDKLNDNRKGTLIEIQNFPTMFKIGFDDGKTVMRLTHEVEIIGWPSSE